MQMPKIACLAKIGKNVLETHCMFFLINRVMSYVVSVGRLGGTKMCSVRGWLGHQYRVHRKGRAQLFEYLGLQSMPKAGL